MNHLWLLFSLSVLISFLLCIVDSRTTASAGASMNEPPKLQQLALNLLATFLVTTLLNNDRLLVVTVHDVHL